MRELLPLLQGDLAYPMRQQSVHEQHVREIRRCARGGLVSLRNESTVSPGNSAQRLIPQYPAEVGYRGKDQRWDHLNQQKAIRNRPEVISIIFAILLPSTFALWTESMSSDHALDPEGAQGTSDDGVVTQHVAAALIFRTSTQNASREMKK